MRRLKHNRPKRHPYVQFLVGNSPAHGGYYVLACRGKTPIRTLATNMCYAFERFVGFKVPKSQYRYVTYKLVRLGRLHRGYKSV